MKLKITNSDIEDIRMMMDSSKGYCEYTVVKI